MNPARDIAVIDQLRAEPAETPWCSSRQQQRQALL
jgi:hypothetical protein